VTSRRWSSLIITEGTVPGDRIMDSSQVDSEHCWLRHDMKRASSQMEYPDICLATFDGGEAQVELCTVQKMAACTS
jgi:hypothetical protein